MSDFVDRNEVRSGNLWTVLANDGGGVRAYSTLMILKALLERIKTVEDEEGGSTPSTPGVQAASLHEAHEALPLLSHYFGAFFGTSAGGLLSLMLGRLQMSIEDALVEFEFFASKVFKNKNIAKVNKYGSATFEEAVKQIVERRTNNRETPLLIETGETSATTPRTAVFTIEQKYNKAVILSSYERNVPENLQNFLMHSGQPATIWQAARATAAAPLHFDEMGINGTYYIDGGVGKNMNNPSIRAWDEVCELLRTDGDEDQPINENVPPIGVFVSIGTGKQKSSHDVGHREWVRRYFRLASTAKRIIVDTQDTHRNMVRLTKWTGVKYFRFNVEKGLEDVKLDQWDSQTIQKIKGATTAYLVQEKTQLKLRRCAKYLVSLMRLKQSEAAAREIAFPGADAALPIPAEEPNVEADNTIGHATQGVGMVDTNPSRERSQRMALPQLRVAVGQQIQRSSSIRIPNPRRTRTAPYNYHRNVSNSLRENEAKRRPETSFSSTVEQESRGVEMSETLAFGLRPRETSSTYPLLNRPSAFDPL